MSAPGRPLEFSVGAGRVPIATYRLQFNQSFTFAQAKEMADYLRDLGVSNVYASPLFQAGPQSTHGYDICSFEQISQELGGRNEFDVFSGRLKELGLGLLLDMVPNHMGTDLSNRWWLDVLQHGRSSPFANYFDIDWQPLNSDLHDKVLLPVLEDHYSAVLESGKLRLVSGPTGFAIAYHERLFPLAPGSCTEILEALARALADADESETLSRAVHEFSAQLREEGKSGGFQIAHSAAIAERIKVWNSNGPLFRKALEQVCTEYQGAPGHPQSFDKLHHLLTQQHYRLSSWRVGPEEINYRRFFDVTQLVSVRMELPEVYEASHRLLFELVRKGQVTGLRIDHPDGLWDPKEYFRRLQLSFLHCGTSGTGGGSNQSWATTAEQLDQELARFEGQEFHRPIEDGNGHTLEAPRTDPMADKSDGARWPIYVVAEKILSEEERLRRDWPVEGTTGYDFLNQVNGLFVDPAAEREFDEIYRRFTGNPLTFAETVYEGKQRILNTSLVSELRALTHRLRRLALATRYGQDFTFNQLHSALFEIIANFPVYRTYVTEKSRAVRPMERRYIEEAFADTKARRPDLDGSLLNFIHDLLLLRDPIDFDQNAKGLSRDFVLRFQQLTGPVTAKGLEDTAFYNYNRLVSLNDVGGDPGRFGISVDQFHQYNLLKAQQWPHALLATATHDTKRGEDVRARLNVLSELPREWHSALQRWSQINQDKKTTADRAPVPHPNDEYLLYQTLLGAWPGEEHDPARLDLAAFGNRINEYMLKAVKEAKARTSWTQPNQAYEKGLQEFVIRILSRQLSDVFLSDFVIVQQRIAFFGVWNSLAQLLLKMTAPGVPDLYQGTELWDLSLVDPDNRRPVDYETRRWLLRELVEQSGQGSGADLCRRLLKHFHNGQIKLYLVWRALELRRQRSALFERGTYLPLRSAGAKSGHVCAFARTWAGQVSVTVVPRLVVGLTRGVERVPIGRKVWEDTTLDFGSTQLEGTYRNVLTGEELGMADSPVPVAQILAQFPVALLARTSTSTDRQT